MVFARRVKGYFTVVTSGHHEIPSDVSEALGGTDRAPDPHALLKASLAACTVMTIQMYADRTGWVLGGVGVTVRIVREGPQTLFSSEVSLEGELSVEQRAALLRIADKCPIHRLLKSDVEIETSLAGATPDPAP